MANRCAIHGSSAAVGCDATCTGILLGTDDAAPRDVAPATPDAEELAWLEAERRLADAPPMVTDPAELARALVDAGHAVGDIPKE